MKKDRISNLISRINSCGGSVERMREEIHDWMNVGLSSLALDEKRNEASRLVDMIEDQAVMQFGLERFNPKHKGALRYLLLKYTRTEQSQFHTQEDLMTGFKVGNTRCLYTTFKGKPRISVYNGYMEFNRVANYHGYWGVEEVQKIMKYLQGWLMTHGAKKLAKKFKPLYREHKLVYGDTELTLVDEPPKKE
jgi:hypothetical protein